MSWNLKTGLHEQVENLSNIVKVECAANGVLGIDSSGKLHVWGPSDSEDRMAEPPAEMGPAIDLETAASGRVCAAQMVDGSWRAWGNDNGMGLIEKINHLGPAVDIAIFQPYNSFCRLIWIEPLEK